MKIILSILNLVFIMLLASSCSKKLQPTIETVYRDSIIERKVIVPKDTTIYIAGDSVSIHDTLPCPDYEAKETSKTGKLTASVSIKNGKLTATCKQDSLQKRITWLEAELTKERYSLKTTTKTVYVPVDVPTPYTPRWHWYLHGFLLLLMLWLFRNPILSFFKHLITKWK